VAAGDDLGSVYLLDAATGETRGQFHGHRGMILALAFSADRTRLLSASDDRTALVWDVQKGLQAQPQRQGRGLSGK
jgi:WD40 repeat protein